MSSNRNASADHIAATLFGRNLPPDASATEVVGRARDKPLVSRFICAAEAFLNVFVDELAHRCGMSVKHLSQLRSGARVDLADAKRVLGELGLDIDTLIQRVGSASHARSDQLIELLLMLLFLDEEEPKREVAEGVVTCDRLAIVLPEATRRRCSASLLRAFEKGSSVFDANYEQSCNYRNVFVGAGLKWKSGRGLRLDFNPSKLTKGGRSFVSRVLAECPAAEVRISCVHVAVDLATQIGWCQVLGTAGRKHTIIGTSRRIETIYVGSRDSKLSYAIYDKREERGSSEPGPLTRIEARHRKVSMSVDELVALADPFAQLRILWLAGDGLNFVDRILTMIGRLYGWSLLKRELDGPHFAQLQSAYEKAAKDRRCVHPSSVFRAQWDAEIHRTLSRIGIEL